MPLLPPKQYVQTIDSFAAHWALVDAALGSPVILSGNYGQAALAADRATLLSQMNAVEAGLNVQSAAIHERTQREAIIRERMRQCIAIVRAVFPDTPYVGLLPALPKKGSAPAIWLPAMAELENAWTQINAMMPIPVGAPVPLILSGGYTLANFSADRAALESAFTACDNANQDVSSAISAREAIWKGLGKRLVHYRLAVKGRFTPTDPLFLSLPSFSPPVVPAPAAVAVKARWEPLLSQAVIEYSECAHPKLLRYELRGCLGGGRFLSKNEVVLGSHAAGDLSPFKTRFGLESGGQSAQFKVFVFVRSRRPKGSKAVSVTRGG